MNFVRGKVHNGLISFGENIIDLTARLRKPEDYEDKEIVFAFRPEAIRLSGDENAYKIHGQVELTEMLGDNTNIYIYSGDAHAILKVDSHDTPETDIPLDFYIPYESVYLFDGETENVIE